MVVGLTVVECASWRVAFLKPEHAFAWPIYKNVNVNDFRRLSQHLDHLKHEGY